MMKRPSFCSGVKQVRYKINELNDSLTAYVSTEYLILYFNLREGYIFGVSRGIIIDWPHVLYICTVLKFNFCKTRAPGHDYKTLKVGVSRVLTYQPHHVPSLNLNSIFIIAMITKCYFGVSHGMTYWSCITKCYIALIMYRLWVYQFETSG